MRAVTFDVSIPRYLVDRTFGRLIDAAVFGVASGVRLSEVDLPPLPGPRWVELEVIAGGICGTDVGNLTFAASPILEPFGSFPAVLGHEILARVRRVARAAASIRHCDMPRRAGPSCSSAALRWCAPSI